MVNAFSSFAALVFIDQRSDKSLSSFASSLFRTVESVISFSFCGNNSFFSCAGKVKLSSRSSSMRVFEDRSSWLNGSDNSGISSSKVCLQREQRKLGAASATTSSETLYFVLHCGH